MPRCVSGVLILRIYLVFRTHPVQFLMEIMKNHACSVPVLESQEHMFITVLFIRRYLLIKGYSMFR